MYVSAKCATSCPLTESPTAYRWYQGGYLLMHSESQQFAVSRLSYKTLSCAVKGHTDLLSAEVCEYELKVCSVLGDSDICVSVSVQTTAEAQMFFHICSEHVIPSYPLKVFVFVRKKKIAWSVLSANNHIQLLTLINSL